MFLLGYAFVFYFKCVQFPFELLKRFSDLITAFRNMHIHDTASFVLFFGYSSVVSLIFGIATGLFARII